MPRDKSLAPTSERAARRRVAPPKEERNNLVPCKPAVPRRVSDPPRTVRLILDVASDLYPNRVPGPAAVIGLPATFSREPYSLTAEVVNDCLLDFIPRRRLLNLLRQDTEAGFQIVRLLSEEIFHMLTAAKLGGQWIKT